MNITLYYSPYSEALAVYVALTEAGAGFQVQAINPRKGEDRTPEYTRITPTQRIPAMTIDGKPLTEVVAMMYFIAHAFPEAGLLPGNFDDEARAIALLTWCASGIHPHVQRLAHPARFCEAPGHESLKRQAIASIHKTFGIAEQRLEGREFLFERFTSADIYLFWCFRRASIAGAPLPAQYPNCNAFFSRVEARPSVQKVYAFEREVLEAFGWGAGSAH